MNVQAYYALHYGKEWLYWSLRSVIPHVSKIHVFYTPTPSHGQHTTAKNPESRDELFDIAVRFPNVQWHDCAGFQHEGFHRDYAVEECRKDGADIVMVVDADEIWPPDVAKECIDVISNNSVKHHWHLIGMRHFWKSLKWVCDDPAMPVRFVIPYADSYDNFYLPGKVFHMGYAQSSVIVDYKQKIHGHKNEWREGWFFGKFDNWVPGVEDVHPTCKDNFWSPRLYEDNGLLESLVGDHPYFGRDII